MFVKIAELPKKIRVAREYEKVLKDSLVTFFRKGKLRKFCITDGIESKEIPFDEAIQYFECEENESKKKLSNVYFDYIAKNKAVFGKPFETEPLVSRQGRSKMDVIVRDLKGLLQYPQYTSDEKAFIQSVINAFGKRQIPEAIAKRLTDFWNFTNGDFIKILTGIRNIVPDSYLSNSVSTKSSKSAQKREIILSELLYPRGE